MSSSEIKNLSVAGAENMVVVSCPQCQAKLKISGYDIYKISANTIKGIML